MCQYTLKYQVFGVAAHFIDKQEVKWKKLQKYSCFNLLCCNACNKNYTTDKVFYWSGLLLKFALLD